MLNNENPYNIIKVHMLHNNTAVHFQRSLLMVKPAKIGQGAGFGFGIGFCMKDLKAGAGQFTSASADVLKGAVSGSIDRTIVCTLLHSDVLEN